MSRANNQVSLESPASAGGAAIGITSSNPAVAVPASVTVPAGSSFTTFPMTTSGVSSTVQSTITASYNGVSLTSVQTLTPASITFLQLSPAAVTGGSPTTNSYVRLYGSAPPGGALIGLSSSDPSVAAVPATVTAPQDAAVSPLFTITTNPVSSSTPVSITATYRGVSRTSTLTVNPGGSLTLSGQITSGGTPLAGVTVDLNTGASTTTNSAGNYSFAGLTQGAAYTITPSLGSSTFTPGSATVPNLSGSQTFNFSRNLYSISGQITSGGSPLGGVSLSLNTGGSTTTSSSGNFSFTDLPPGASFTVTPSLAGSTFNPATVQITNLGGDRTANFTRNTHVISGHILSAGSPLPGVLISLSTGASATTNSSGDYSFSGLAPGTSYTITPSLAGSTFTPASATLPNLMANATADFVRNTYVISGQVMSGGSPIPNVTVSLSTGGAATTSSSGTFAFSNLVPGSTYVVTPALAGFTFVPANASFPTF